jgi:hypothetical protein
VRPCQQCGHLHFKRVKREGFIERWLLAAYGVYPWRCTNCEHKRYLPRRGKRVHRDGTAAETD